MLLRSKKHNKVLVGTDILPDPELPHQPGVSLEFSVLFIYYLVEQIFTKRRCMPQSVSEAGKIENQMAFLSLITLGSDEKK